MRYRTLILYGSLFFFNKFAVRIEAKPYDAILRFMQQYDEDEDYEEPNNENSFDEEENEENYDEEEKHEDESHSENDVPEEESKEPEVDKVVEKPKSAPTWVDEQDLMAEFESSQNDRANDLSVKALQKRRAANSLRVYCRGIEEELEKAKKRTNGMKKLDSFKLTTQLENNLARASLLYKEADLLDEKAREAKKSLEQLNSNDKEKILLRDCNMLKIGPLSYSSRYDNVLHMNREPLMGKLTGNSLVLYNNKIPQLTYYMVDIELPTKPVDSAPRCLSFNYRGAPQVLCAATMQSAHSWMNAISEAWFCKHFGIKGTLVNLKMAESKDKKAELLKHAVKQRESKGVVNMEVFVDDKNTTHLLVEGKERPLSSISDLIDINQIVKDKKSANKKAKASKK